MPRWSFGWWTLLAVTGPLAIVAVAHWIWAIVLRVPVMYGEGAVAHAAMLARDRLEYATLGPTSDLIFVAANYPPLYFQLAGIGDPFVTGRVLSIASTVFVAGAIAWTARAGGTIVALALATAWLAAIPVTVWGTALKPDLLALALTVGAVVVLARRPVNPVLAGILIALAMTAKPTAALPAMALGVLLVVRDRGDAMRYSVAALATALAVFAATGNGNSRLPPRPKVYSRASGSERMSVIQNAVLGETSVRRATAVPGE